MWRHLPGLPGPPGSSTKKYELGFPLLADEEHAMAEPFGVWGEKANYGPQYLGIIRSAFVIDEKGKIVDAFYKVSPKATIASVKSVL